MIDFELDAQTQQMQQAVNKYTVAAFRKIARYYDEEEHSEAVELVEATKMLQQGGGDAGEKESAGKGPKQNYLTDNVIIEELSYGDLGLMIANPYLGLGNSAITAVGSPEQKAKYGKKGAAMAITEPGCGSDSSAITTTARLDPETNEWVLNGEKIFVTGGRTYDICVVWATLDRSVGRAAIKSFLVEQGTPGMTISKLEDKLGIRASDTAAIVFDNCRIPYENILGDPEILPKEGFKGVLATFDASRPAVAAFALGVGRAALEFTKEELAKEGITIPYDCGQHKLSATQKAILDMEANLEAARFLTWRSATMLNAGVRNSLEASMGKAKAGKVASQITQKCVELLGPVGYSREHLLEKWMRDVKITDIFEGTGQIQLLIIARQILGYSRRELQ